MGDQPITKSIYRIVASDFHSLASNLGRDDLIPASDRILDVHTAAVSINR